MLGIQSLKLIPLGFTEFQQQSNKMQNHRVPQR
jgi:hypothetical protein